MDFCSVIFLILLVIDIGIGIGIFLVFSEKENKRIEDIMNGKDLS